jgi:hypothetical protein
VVAKLGERAGALMASIAMTFPMNAGPGFFFIALDHDAAFVRAGALVSFTGTGAVLAFAASFVALARRHGFAAGLAASLLAWLAVALLTLALPRSLLTAAVLIALGVLLVRLLRTARVAALPHTAQRAGWHLLLLRGVLAGLVVAGVAAAARSLGPTFAGLAYAFPTTMLAALWVLQRHYGPAFTLATMARVPAGIATYAGFCLALHLAAGPLPPLPAWSLAVLTAVLIALLRARLGQRRAPATFDARPPRPT